MIQIKTSITESLRQFMSIHKRRFWALVCFPTHLNGFSPSGFHIHGVKQSKLSLHPTRTLAEHLTQDTSACEYYVHVTM